MENSISFNVFLLNLPLVFNLLYCCQYYCLPLCTCTPVLAGVAAACTPRVCYLLCYLGLAPSWIQLDCAIPCTMINFILLFSRQGQIRLQKQYKARESKEKKTISFDESQRCATLLNTKICVLSTRGMPASSSALPRTRGITSWGCWR